MDAAIYCRISDDREGAGLGVSRQRADCEALAAQRGWTVVDRYVDNDISAYSGKPRPEYRRMLADVEGGRVHAIVTWHLDRLHRQPKELESFIDLIERHKVALASVSGEHDLGTPEGRLYARILGAVARAESEHKSRRVRRKKIENARQGKPSGGGPRGYGYTLDRGKQIPEEAAVIRELTERLLAGQSVRSLAIELNQRGVPTSAGGRWDSAAVKRIVTSPRVAGIVDHPEVGPTAAQWKPIITETQRAQLIALFADPRRRMFKTKPPRRLLTGLLRCGLCGGPIVGGPRCGPHRYQSYHCHPHPNRGCGKILILAHLVEPYLVEAALSVWDSIVLNPEEQSPAPSIDEEMESIAADRAMLEELARLYAERTISTAEWLAARSPIEERIGVATREISDRSLDDAVVHLRERYGDIRSAWPSLSTDVQRTVLGAVIERVVVQRAGKGTRFDPGKRLTVTWRV